MAGQDQGAEQGEEKAEETAEDAQPAEAPPAKAKAKAKADDNGSARQPPPPGGIADLLAQALPDVKLEAYQGLTNVIVEVDRDDIPKVMPVAKDDPRLDLKFLRSLFGVDHQEEGLEGVYHLLSLEHGHEVAIKTRLPQDDPRVASVTSVWKGANWHEREARDMFGITFDGHPHLVPLLLPEDMTDHFPLRKESELAPMEEWQGEALGESMASAGHIPSGSGFEVEASAEGE